MKSERLYIRTTQEKKEFLQRVALAHDEFNGEITAVVDYLIEKFMEEVGDQYE